MSHDRRGPYQGNPYQGGPYQDPRQWAPGAGGPSQGTGQGTGYGRRIDALDVLEGVLKDGFSLSNFTRIARASGSNFWVGAAIGAGLVVLANRPDVRAAVAGIFSQGHGRDHGHNPAPSSTPEAGSAPPSGEPPAS